METTPPRDRDQAAVGVTMRSDPPASRPPAPNFEFSARVPGPSQVRCPRCGIDNTAPARFCAACGLSFEHPSVRPPIDGLGALPVVDFRTGPEEAPRVACPRCEGGNPASVRFCQHCGAPLRSSAPAMDAVGLAIPASDHASSSPPVETGLETAPIPLVASTPSSQPRSAQPGPLDMPVSRQAAASLVVIAQDGSPGNRYPLELSQVDIGRTEGDIRLPGDPYVSPRHARIVRRDGRTLIRDLDSLNGIYIRARHPQVLTHGDLILIGLQVLRFEAVPDSPAGHGVAVENGVNVFGSPLLPRLARLSQMTVEGTTRNVYILTTNETVIGRESGDIVFTTDPFMSRTHAVLVRDPESGSFTLRDLDSSNGSYIALRQESALSDGDFLRIGQHLFRFDLAWTELSQA